MAVVLPVSHRSFATVVVGWFFLLTAILATTRKEASWMATATATATYDAAAAAANQPVIAMKKGSVISIKLEAMDVELKPNPSNQNPSETEEEGSSAEAANDEDDTNEGETDESPSFPGIYTAHYTYHASMANIGSWLQESDVIRTECENDDVSDGINANNHNDSVGPKSMDEIMNTQRRDEDEDEEGSDSVSDSYSDSEHGSDSDSGSGNAVRAKSLRCKGYLLIRSKDEYRGIASKQSSPSLSNHNPCLRSLEYNPALTKLWIHPRMKVAEEHIDNNAAKGEVEGEDATKANRSRRLGHLYDHDNDNDIESPRNAQADFNDYQYSTIALHDCYYDYQGTMDWIRDFLAKSAVSPLLEVTWTDIGDSWKKTKSENDGGSEGYDIYALTITGKPKPRADTVTESAEATTTSASFDAFFGRSDALEKNRNADSTGSSSSSSSTDTPTTSKSVEDDTEEDKAPFLIVTSTHAREYTPPVLVRLWLEHLIEKVEAGDPASLGILEHTKIHWIPYLNPDGRVIAETTEPLRRKNLNNEWTGNIRDSAICDEDSFGVDLNRNCPLEWGKDDGSTDKPCSSFTRGAAPGSEPETRAMVDYATSIFPKEQQKINALNAGGTDYSVAHIDGVSTETSSTIWRGYDPLTTRGVFVDVHAYGKVYIYPWGNTNNISPNDAQFRSTMGHIQALTGNEARGPGPSHYGVASGATDDWAYGVLGALSMTWELGSAFHEPCDDFENDYKKHFGAFAHLASIAPFPFALGSGPIVLTTFVLPTLALYYLPSLEEQFVTDTDTDLDSEAPFHLNSNSNSTVTTSREIFRMGTNTIPDLGDTLEIVLALKLPDVIPSDEDPIDFDLDDRDDGSSSSSSSREPSSIVGVRIFFRGGNPLVGATSADSASTDRIGDFWDLDVSRNENSDDERLYQISLSKTRLWEAFGGGGGDDDDNDDGYEADSDSDFDSITEHVLYFQAVDDVGNRGPVRATHLTVVVRNERDEFLSWPSVSPPSVQVAKTAFLAPTSDEVNSFLNITDVSSSVVVARAGVGVPYGFYFLPALGFLGWVAGVW